MLSPSGVAAEQTVIHVPWINAVLSCTDDPSALTAATQLSIEEPALAAFPVLSQGKDCILGRGP